MDWAERLGRVFKGMASRGGAAPTDPDEVLREAGGPSAAKPGPRSSSRPAGGLPPEVQRAYANLELEPPASLEAAKQAWRQLMARFHPDKFQHDPAKEAAATKVAARLTDAYRIVKEHLGG